MKKITALSLGLVLVAGSALASNTGFKLNYTLSKPAGKSGNNWVSVPYFYFPDGNVANLTQNSVSFCSDLNEGVAGAPKVKTVFRFNTSSDTALGQSCTSAIKVYDLKKGEGYSLIPAVDNTVVNIVGSMDDTFAKNKTTPVTPYTLSKPAGKTGNNWFSVPYHIKSDNSVDLCKDLNDNAAGAPNVKTVFRFVTSSDTALGQSCTSAIKVYDLKAGEGVSLIPAVDLAKVSTTVY